MTDITAETPALPPEPGEVADHDLGIPGDPEPLPEGDADRDEPSAVNDETEDDIVEQALARADEDDATEPIEEGIDG